VGLELPGHNSGHLTVYPRRHLTSFLSLTGDEISEMSHLVQRGEAALRRIYRFDGLNLGVNSGTGEHVNLQIIPRWAGDHNYLPLVAGLKLVPDSPSQAWCRLREVLQ
jgi:ATP adenylyltransferase